MPERGHVNVRFGSLAAAPGHSGRVRFTSESGHEGLRSACPLRAKLRHLTAMTASDPVQKPDSGFGQAFAGDAVEDRQHKKDRQSELRRRGPTD
jgi:hypothetical protein